MPVILAHYVWTAWDSTGPADVGVCPARTFAMHLLAVTTVAVQASQLWNVFIDSPQVFK